MAAEKVPSIRRPPASTAPSLYQQALQVLDDILFRDRYYWPIVGLWLTGEVGLCLLTIRYVPYTNIDYLAYTQQSTLFLPPSSTRHYPSLVGDTGPLVYPALHLYIYSFLNYLFPEGGLEGVGGFVPGKAGLEGGTGRGIGVGLREGLRPLQLIWMGVYVGTLGVVAVIAKGMAGVFRRENSKKVQKKVETLRHLHTSIVHKSPHPPYPPLQSPPLPPTPLLPTLLLISLSKRLHSIYILRLFNDPLAMFLLYVSVVAMQRGWWKGGCLGWSLALGIKMNILLFAPGLLVLLFQYQGIVHGTICVGLVLAAQLILAIPFLPLPTTLLHPLLPVLPPTISSILSHSSQHNDISTAQTYFTSAFDFSRKFLFEWSVNWNFLGRERFEEEWVGRGLLGVHLALIIIFAAFRWCNIPSTSRTTPSSSDLPNGVFSILRTGLSAPWKAPLPPGGQTQSFRSAHVPYVLFTSNILGILTARSMHYQFFSWYAHQYLLIFWMAKAPLIVILPLWATTLYAWDSFPPSKLASMGMLMANLAAVGASWIGGGRLTRGRLVDIGGKKDL